MNKDKGAFSKMFNKRTHVHHFIGEGAEEGNFHEAYSGLKSLIGEYKELEKDSIYNNNEEEEEKEENDKK